MKNNKFPKWLHCLPVLLLALILAVMPLTMAAPAYADVLSGGVSDTGVVLVDGGTPLCNLPYFVRARTPQLFIPIIYADGNEYFFKAVFITGFFGLAFPCSLSGSVFSASYCFVSVSDPVLFSPDVSFYNVNWSEFVSYEGDYFSVDIGLAEFAYLNGQVNFTSSEQFEFYPLEIIYPAYGGVLSVFTGVANFLSGAVQNISTMFWTAESGMTVLGYLAVASLALAVILLIFYLIAGWLKFH